MQGASGDDVRKAPRSRWCRVLGPGVMSMAALQPWPMAHSAALVELVGRNGRRGTAGRSAPPTRVARVRPRASLCCRFSRCLTRGGSRKQRAFSPNPHADTMSKAPKRILVTGAAGALGLRTAGLPWAALAGRVVGCLPQQLSHRAVHTASQPLLSLSTRQLRGAVHMCEGQIGYAISP